MSTLNPLQKYHVHSSSGKTFMVSLEKQPVINVMSSKVTKPALPCAPPQLMLSKPKSFNEEQEGKRLNASDVIATQKRQNICQSAQSTKMLPKLESLSSKQSPTSSQQAKTINSAKITKTFGEIDKKCGSSESIYNNGQVLHDDKEHDPRTHPSSSIKTKNGNTNTTPNTSPMNTKKQLSPEDMKKELQRMYGGMTKVTLVQTPNHTGHSEFCSCKVKGHFYQ